VEKFFVMNALRNMETSFVQIARVEKPNSSLMQRVSFVFILLGCIFMKCFPFFILAAEEIKNLPVKCTNSNYGCDWTGYESQRVKHEEMCDYELVSCDYKHIGCNAKMTKIDMEMHKQLEDSHHFHLALHSIATPTLSRRDGLVLELAEYNIKKQNNEVFLSNPFYTHLNGYKIGLKIFANGAGSCVGTHLSLSMCFLNGPFDSHLHWPFKGRIEVWLLN